MTSYLDILNRPALEALGIEGFAYGFADQVRFYELDALNHVNNVVFLKWFETVRVRYFQDYGLSRYGAPGDPQLVVRRVTTDFLAPMVQNESYVVTARTRLVKPSSFVMTYGVFRDGSAVAVGEAVCVSLTADGSARQAHRAGAVARMIERDGAEDQTG